MLGSDVVYKKNFADLALICKQGSPFKGKPKVHLHPKTLKYKLRLDGSQFFQDFLNKILSLEKSYENRQNYSQTRL